MRCKNLKNWMLRQILLYIFILFACSVNAEQFKITGTVVDETILPPILMAISALQLKKVKSLSSLVSDTFPRK